MTDEQEGAAVVAALRGYTVGEFVKHPRHKLLIARVAREESASGRSVLIQWQHHTNGGMIVWGMPVWVSKRKLRRID